MTVCIACTDCRRSIRIISASHAFEHEAGQRAFRDAMSRCKRERCPLTITVTQTASEDAAPLEAQA